MSEILRVMFVCHGNICRSPMAEFIMKKLVRERGIAAGYEISSSATSDEEIWGGAGNPVYPKAREELLRHGIGCDGKRAVQLCRADYNKYDLFVGMDSANIRNMYRIFGSDPEGKIKKLMDFTGRGGDVSDPWYSRRFDVAYKDIYEGVTALLDECEKNA